MKTYRTLVALAFLACLGLLGLPRLTNATFRRMPKMNLVEKFDNDRGEWTSVSGTQQYTSGFLNLIGDGTNDASVFYNVRPFGEVDFAASMMRTGCSSCANGLVILGYPYVDTLGRWDTGFEFYYDNYGFFRVYKRMAEASNFQSIIKPKTFSYAINRGGWNTLRVQSKGNVSRFFINNVLVYQYTQTDRFLTYGFIGIIMSSGNTTDTLSVATAWIQNSVSFKSAQR